MADRPDGKKKSKWIRAFVMIARGSAMMLVLVMLIGLVLLWRFPALAKNHNVELTDLLLRSIDAYTLDPLHYLQDDRPLAKVRPGFPDEADNVITTRKGPYLYEHAIQVKAEGSNQTNTSRTIQSTTPHTTIPPEELVQARATLRTLFPEDSDEFRQLRGWGRTMFVLWWHKLEQKPKNPIEPADGTEDEHLWFAWKRLEADLPLARSELANLPDLLEQTYPKDEDRRAAMKWAEEMYVNLNRIPGYYVRDFNSKTQDARKNLPNAVSMPPRSEWTLIWLLYTHQGLTPDSRREVKDRWWSAFRPDRPDVVLQWCEQVRKERVVAGEALPPGGDDVSLLCGVQRLSGTDAYGIRCRELFWKEMNEGKSDPTLLHMTLVFGGFPNDEIYFVAATGDSLEVAAELSDVGARLGRLMLFFVLLWGINGWVFNLLGKRLLKLEDNDRYLHFRDRRKLTTLPPAVFVAFALTPLLGWVLAWVSTPLWLQALISPWRLLVEVYVSVLMGGILFVFLSQTVAVLLIKMGIDPETTFLDEIITIPLGVFILLHFGNDVLSIVSFVALSVVPELILRLHQSDKDAPKRKLTAWLMGLGILGLFVAVGINSEKRRAAKKVPSPSTKTTRLRLEFCTCSLQSKSDFGDVDDRFVGSLPLPRTR